MKPLAELTFPELVVLLHRALGDGGIDHAFGGGLALAFHVARPRATRDIDVGVSADGRRVEDVLRSLPAGVRWGPKQARTAEVLGAVKLRWVRGIPVDLFFPVDDLARVALERAETHVFAGSAMKFVTATDLAVLKATFDRGTDRTGKERDWLDIRAMLQAGTVDVAEATRWIRRAAPHRGAELARFTALIEDVRCEAGDAASPWPDGHRLPDPPAP